MPMNGLRRNDDQSMLLSWYSKNTDCYSCLTGLYALRLLSFEECFKLPDGKTA